MAFLGRGGGGGVAVHGLMLLLLMMMISSCNAVHFETVFNSDKVAAVVDSTSSSSKVKLRLRRETLVKHKTQHLKPAIEIEPINEKTNVAMPHFNMQDLPTYASQAAAAIATRFDEFEPTLLASNGNLKDKSIIDFLKFVIDIRVKKK